MDVPMVSGIAQPNDMLVGNTPFRVHWPGAPRSVGAVPVRTAGKERLLEDSVAGLPPPLPLPPCAPNAKPETVIAPTASTTADQILVRFIAASSRMTGATICPALSLPSDCSQHSRHSHFLNVDTSIAIARDEDQWAA
ncbi:MAG: hypothetical protein IPJ28_06005 [Betaproteobacteria bacterium]|nr:hypothetical protein [Betaproteobacteria bacterium]